MSDKRKHKKQSADPRKVSGRFLNAATVCGAIFALFAYFMLAMRNGYVLRWYDDQSLFEPNAFFFRQFLCYPGGLLRYAGCWLTQLMFYPALGSVVLIAIWLLLGWVTCKGFRIPNMAAPLAFFVPMAMLASIVQMDEAWLTLKTPGYIYSNSLGYLVSSGMIWWFRASRGCKSIYLILPTILTLTYPFFGFFSLLAAAICIIFFVVEGFKESDYWKLAAAAIAIAFILVVPKIYYIYVPGNLADNDFLYLKGLPELLMESFDFSYWIPFILATLWMLLSGIFCALGWIRSNRLWLWIGFIAVFLSMVWNLKVDRKSERFRASVLMMHHLENHNWSAITNMMDLLKEPPTYSMLVINNLARAYQGIETLQLPKFSPELTDGRHNETFTTSVFVKVPVNFYIGENNESYRWCMEHNVQYGKRVFFIKYMVKNALANGEIELAKRYNDILLRTMFHRQWAQEMNRLIENPSLIESDPEFLAVKAFRE